MTTYKTMNNNCNVLNKYYFDFGRVLFQRQNLQNKKKKL